MEKAIVPLLLLLVVIIALLLIQNRLKHKKEGFDLISSNNQKTFGSSWSEYANAGAQTFNPIMNLIAPSRNTLLTPNFSKDELRNVQGTVQQAVTGTKGYPNDPSFDITPGNIDDIQLNPESAGTAIDLLKKCEAVMTKDCSAFSNTEFAANCGICFDGGVDSKGSPKVGGLYISSQDREAAEYNAKKMGSRKVNYQPSVGKCAPNKFYVTQNKCVDAQRELLCQQQQSFETPGCGQCLQDGEFHYVASDTPRSSSVLMLVGNGQVTVKKMSSTETPVRLTLGSTSQAVGLDMLEGDSIQITVSYDTAGAITGPLTIAGYLSGITASGKFIMDIFPLIPIDTISNGKPRISGNISVDTNSCTSMRMGMGAKSMNLVLTNPFTFLDPAEENSIMCPTSPYVTSPASSTILNSSPCFTKGQGAGNYSLPCIQSIFQNIGCTAQGNMYPTTASAAKALSVDANGNPLTVGGVGNLIAALYQKATTGKDLGGKPLSVNDWNDSSMKCLGIPRTSACDEYDQANGPLGANCLSLLWQNAGQNIPALGSTYTGSSQISSLNPNLKEGFLGQTQYCTTKGSMSPLNSDGSPNQMTIDIANSQGGIANVKSFYDAISKTANDNTKTDDARSLAIEQCYGVTLNPQIPAGTDVSQVGSYNQPSVFDTPPPPPPPPPSNLKVTVYEHCWYNPANTIWSNGKSAILPVGRYTATNNNLGIPDKSLSSMKIPAGLKVTLYQNPDFTGRSLVLTGDVWCLTDSKYNVQNVNFNDLTSSFVIENASGPPAAPAPVAPPVPGAPTSGPAPATPATPVTPVAPVPPGPISAPANAPIAPAVPAPPVPPNPSVPTNYPIAYDSKPYKKSIAVPTLPVVLQATGLTGTKAVSIGAPGYPLIFGTPVAKIWAVASFHFFYTNTLQTPVPLTLEAWSLYGSGGTRITFSINGNFLPQGAYTSSTTVEPTTKIAYSVNTAKALFPTGLRYGKNMISVNIQNQVGGVFGTFIKITNTATKSIVAVSNTDDWKCI